MYGVQNSVPEDPSTLPTGLTRPSFLVAALGGVAISAG